MRPQAARAVGCAFSVAQKSQTQGMDVCLRFAMERPPRPWVEQVLPYRLAEMMLITPSRWTLTEVAREVRLP